MDVKWNKIIIQVNFSLDMKYWDKKENNQPNYIASSNTCVSKIKILILKTKILLYKKIIKRPVGMDFRVQIWGMIKALNLRTIEALKSICSRLITLAQCTLKCYKRFHTQWTALTEIY